MRGATTFILLLFSALAFAQQDTITSRLADLKLLYDRKKITLQTYQELSSHLLRPSETSQPVETSTGPGVNVTQTPLPSVPVAKFEAESYSRTEEYCIVKSTTNSVNTKAWIEVDFGQKKKINVDNRPSNEGGRMADFDNIVDALNFMNSKGWEVCGSNQMPASGTTVYHYLLKRKIK